jgi:hypothetical protein
MRRSCVEVRFTNSSGDHSRSVTFAAMAGVTRDFGKMLPCDTNAVVGSSGRLENSRSR